ncbi:hypothetical protein [Rhizobium lentis]|uniref:hypothetical protein n=1 Tax=Rhizobium lentis TaxID=1138194 RepID=UPI001C830EB6|nr:hypothetical protein [Rhizobium lentis]MBX5046978.1 hypothetical protein [Rhizobium lentis]MBX5058990.1 hypothetical protein [Rhizobium lentis]
MAEVISLSEARARRRKGAPFDPLAEFDASMEVLFASLDLLDGTWDPKVREARRKVCEGIELLLRREERILAWTRK